ncbi:MAG: rhomboid family intramembrane serine protease [Polyangiaceae bacterium]
MARRPADTNVMQMQWPKPGPVTIALLVLLGGMSVLQAALVNLLRETRAFEFLVGDASAIRHGQVWRLITSSLLTSPQGIGHILFSLLLFYFFMPDLEKRWKSSRLVLFLLYASVFGHAFTVFIDWIAFDHPLLHTKVFYGPGTIDSAVSVAWSLTNPGAQIRLLFFIPVRGAWLKWITLGFALIGGILYASSIPEGAFSLVGGWGVGMLLGGTPSVLRAFYLRLKRNRLERSIAKSGGSKSSPPLKLVYGGLADELGLDKDKKKPGSDRTIH